MKNFASQMDSDTVVVVDDVVAVVGYGRISSYLEISGDGTSSWSWLELWPPCCYWQKQKLNSDDRRDSSQACPSSCVASKLTFDEYACDLAKLFPIPLETDSLFH